MKTFCAYRQMALSLVIALLFNGAALAHHSAGGVFDLSKHVTLSGVISKVDWSNPHIHFYLEVKDTKGKIDTWEFETVPPAFMRKAGMTKAKLMGSGETVTVTGSPAWDAQSHRAFLEKIARPDGTFFEVAPEGSKPE